MGGRLDRRNHWLSPLMGLLLLLGCSTDPARHQRSALGTGAQEPAKVLATFTVLADMARQVSCGKLQVESITKPGAEIHGYEFTPSDLRRAQGAALVLENGLDLELWSRRFIANLDNVPHVVVSDGVSLLPIARDTSSGDPSGQSERSSKTNPHAWMSPKGALTYVANIRKAFIRLDPANAATYRRCAEAYADQLRQLDRELAERVAELPPDQRLLVTCEGAFSYLARDYGLEEAWLWPVNGEREVTPQRMERVIRTVRERQVPAVFCESTVDSRAQQRVAAETGASLAGTFFVDSLSAADGPASSYLELMRHNVATLVAGLNSDAGPGTGDSPSGRSAP